MCLLFKFAKNQFGTDGCVCRKTGSWCCLGFIASKKQTKGEERALVPIKTKLVVAVLEADFAEISLMRNVNVVWEGGKRCISMAG